MELIVNQAIKLPGGTEIVLRPDVGKSATAGRELDLNEVVHRILERVEGRPLRGCQVEIETPCSLAGFEYLVRLSPDNLTSSANGCALSFALASPSPVVAALS